MDKAQRSFIAATVERVDEVVTALRSNERADDIHPMLLTTLPRLCSADLHHAD